MDQYFAQLKKAARNLEECRVVADEEGDHYALEDGELHVHIELTPTGERIWADIQMAMAGGGGAMVRVPKPGDTGIVAMPRGDKNRAHVLGWTSSSSAMAAADVEADAYFLRPPDGEGVIIRVDGADILLEAAGGQAALEVKDNGQIVATSGDVRLGSSSASSPVALSPKVDSNNSTHTSWAAGHTHLYVAPLIPLPGPPVPSAPPLPTPPSPTATGANKVKGE